MDEPFADASAEAFSIQPQCACPPSCASTRPPATISTTTPQNRGKPLTPLHKNRPKRFKPIKHPHRRSTRTLQGKIPHAHILLRLQLTSPRRSPRPLQANIPRDIFYPIKHPHRRAPHSGNKNPETYSTTTPPDIPTDDHHAHSRPKSPRTYSTTTPPDIPTDEQLVFAVCAALHGADGRVRGSHLIEASSAVSRQWRWALLI